MNILDGMDYRTIGFAQGIAALLFTPLLMKSYSFSDFASQAAKVVSRVLFVFFMLLLPVGTFLVFLSFRGYNQFGYLGVLLLVVGIAPAIKILKNREHVSSSIMLLGYTEIVIIIALFTVGIIGYGHPGWFSITDLVGSWAGVRIWAGLIRLSILLTVCLIISRFIKQDLFVH
jgi:hypothetical protein